MIRARRGSKATFDGFVRLPIDKSHDWDLGDAVADELSLPFDQISVEMIYPGLYHFSVARQKGLATDPVKYFAAPENRHLLGIVKRKQNLNTKLIVAPFPQEQRASPHFFFDDALTPRLTS